MIYYKYYKRAIQEIFWAQHGPLRVSRYHRVHLARKQFTPLAWKLWSYHPVVWDMIWDKIWYEIWYDIILYITWHDHDMTWQDTICYGIWYDNDYIIRCDMIWYIITYIPLFWGGAAYVYETPMGDSCLVMHIHNPFMHCAASQYVFKPRDVIMLNNRISVATITYMYATASPCRVPLNGMFHQDSATQWSKLQNLKKKVTLLCQIH